jgi:DNA sulfur modification protein DndD
MKLKSARIRNFKLLRDVILEFSEDRNRPLTVIRAENGSGKTSTLIALRWALYGSRDGLDDPTMRLSPTTWPDQSPCEVSVQLDFSHTLYNRIAGENVPTTTDYRLVRTAIETPEGNHPNRGEDRPTLYRYTDAGLDKVDPPELLVRQMLPLEMKDIFFTDGDAALSFISPQLSQSAKRDQVKEAIRALLGVELLESADTHIAGARRKYNSYVSRAAQSQQLTDIAERLLKAQAQLDDDQARLRQVEHQIEELARRFEESDKRLQVALMAGDQIELARQRELAQRQLAESRRSEAALKEQHRSVLQDELLSLAVMGSRLTVGFNELVKLHDAGIIPSGSVPVLAERLQIGKCVCGTPLTPGSKERQNLEELIDRQKTVDAKRKGLTELHNAARVDLQRVATAGPNWVARLDNLERTRLSNRKAAEAAAQQLQICEEKLARIDQARLADARKERDAVQVALTRKQDERRDLQTAADHQARRVAEQKPLYDNMLRQDAKLSEVNARLTVTEDMTTVVQGVLEDLQLVYLTRVSDRMNAMFLEMVGADPAAMSGDEGDHRSQVFRSAEITPRYQIVVNSGENRTLNPEFELNGASKRALTFSFIWALTEVSQVTAPRIIDTPLGMMSGAVKKRVIELITTPAGDTHDLEKQVVLFLTRDEIRGTEDVIDQRAGRIYTFTNGDHYPVDLVNDPDVDPDVAQILRCECSHRQFCRICARKNDALYDLTDRPVV